LNGKWVHARQANSLRGTVVGLIKKPVLDKHRYLYPLDSAIRKQVSNLSKPYPKAVIRGIGEIDNAQSSNSETGGASPTIPL
jgi:hypothetical protein